MPHAEKDFGREAVDEIMKDSAPAPARCHVPRAAALARRRPPLGGAPLSAGARSIHLVRCSVPAVLSGDPVVIIAGYVDEMSHFLQSNAGLARRFEHTLTFPDYTPSELCQIFAIKAAEAGFGLAPELGDGAPLGPLLERSTSAAWRASAAAGNARVAERMYHAAYEALTRREPQSSVFTMEDLQTACHVLGELSKQWHEREVELSSKGSPEG